MAAKIVLHQPFVESDDGLIESSTDIVIRTKTIPVSRIHGHFPKFCHTRDIYYFRDDHDLIHFELTSKHDANEVYEAVVAELRQIHGAAVNEI